MTPRPWPSLRRYAAFRASIEPWMEDHRPPMVLDDETQSNFLNRRVVIGRRHLNPYAIEAKQFPAHNVANRSASKSRL